ncbi:MAG: Low molecular weight protein-tyrosine-phosphatase yfkJ [Pseudomonadota bacterium]
MGKKDTTSFAMSTRVLFVCMGNICRSPMAEGVFRQLVRQAGLDEVVSMESAGTHSFHAGESADKRAIASAQKRGVDISAHTIFHFCSKRLRRKSITNCSCSCVLLPSTKVQPYPTPTTATLKALSRRSTTSKMLAQGSLTWRGVAQPR